MEELSLVTQFLWKFYQWSKDRKPLDEFFKLRQYTEFVEYLLKKGREANNNVIQDYLRVLLDMYAKASLDGNTRIKLRTFILDAARNPLAEKLKTRTKISLRKFVRGAFNQYMREISEWNFDNVTDNYVRARKIHEAKLCLQNVIYLQKKFAFLEQQDLAKLDAQVPALKHPDANEVICKYYNFRAENLTDVVRDLSMYRTELGKRNKIGSKHEAALAINKLALIISTIFEHSKICNTNAVVSWNNRKINFELIELGKWLTENKSKNQVEPIDLSSFINGFESMILEKWKILMESCKKSHVGNCTVEKKLLLELINIIDESVAIKYGIFAEIQENMKEDLQSMCSSTIEKAQNQDSKTFRYIIDEKINNYVLGILPQNFDSQESEGLDKEIQPQVYLQSLNCVMGVYPISQAVEDNRRFALDEQISRWILITEHKSLACQYFILRDVDKEIDVLQSLYRELVGKDNIPEHHIDSVTIVLQTMFQIYNFNENCNNDGILSSWYNRNVFEYLSVLETKLGGKMVLLSNNFESEDMLLKILNHVIKCLKAAQLDACLECVEEKKSLPDLTFSISDLIWQKPPTINVDEWRKINKQLLLLWESDEINKEVKTNIKNVRENVLALLGTWTFKQATESN